MPPRRQHRRSPRIQSGRRRTVRQPANAEEEAKRPEDEDDDNVEVREATETEELRARLRALEKLNKTLEKRLKNEQATDPAKLARTVNAVTAQCIANGKT